METAIHTGVFVPAEHECTVIAGLALAALNYADPTCVYDALKALYPLRDFSEWIAATETHRAKARELQDVAA